MTVRMDSESQHIEVHKFYAGAVLGICFLSLVLQAFLNRFSPRFQTLELPLLAVVYFGLSRRNSITGLLLGTVVGLLQDGISHTPIGLYGIAKGFIGYIASSIGARLDTEHPISRFILMFLFFSRSPSFAGADDPLASDATCAFLHVPSVDCVAHQCRYCGGSLRRT